MTNSLNMTDKQIAEQNEKLLDKGYYLEVGDDGMTQLLPTEEKKAERIAVIQSILNGTQYDFYARKHSRG